MKLVLFYFCFDWVLIIINLYFIYKVVSVIKQNRNDRNAYSLNIYSTMKWYPIVLIVCSIPGTVNRIYGIVTNESNFVMMILQGVFDYLQGLFIMIIFISGPQMMENLRLCFGKLFRSQRERESMNSKTFTKISTTYGYDTAFDNTVQSNMIHGRESISDE